MKFAAILVGLVGITSVTALATPANLNSVEVRQDAGLITQLNTAIDALQAQLANVAVDANEAVQIQNAIDALQATLDFLTT